MIIDHNLPEYRQRWQTKGANRFNGAFFYSKEIVKFIIPNVKTDRSWITINTLGYGANHAILFVHNNLEPERYNWTKKYEDIIFVCSLKSTCEKVKHLGKTIYLPLSIDTEDVKKYRCEKDKDTAFAGRPDKRALGVIPYNCDCLMNLPRTQMLRAMARYRRIYGVGRIALEAKCLGCEVLPYDKRFQDPSIWKVLDSRDAAKILQKELDKIDKGKNLPPIGTKHPKYIEKRNKLHSGKFNGAYYYSKEIIKNIIPNVKTDRPWDTLGMRAVGSYNRAIVFIHHNKDMDRVYNWLKGYDDLVLVVSSPYTLNWAKQAGYKAIYLPLSIDTEYVSKFKTEKTKDTCYCGNIWSFRREEIERTIPAGVDFQPKEISRDRLLKFMAPYKKVYAIGRCALEAKCLGAELLQCYEKFDIDHWQVLDNKDAAKILQKELDKIDGK